MRAHRSLAWIERAVAAVGLFSSMPAGAEGDVIAAMRAMRARDARVVSVGYRLASGARALCDLAVPLIGFAVQDIGQYAAGQQAAARAAFGLTDDPAVLALAGDSPAAAAGLRADDAIVRIEGAAVPGGEGEARVTATLDRLDSAAADGVLELDMRRGGVARHVVVRPATGCATRFETRESRRVDAQADGGYVVATTGLVDFAANDEELAAALAHELAHNILGHRQRLRDAHVARGIGGQFGRSARLTREVEVEADRMSVRLLRLAGYDPRAAVTLWTRLADRGGLDALPSATHLRPRARVALITAEIAREQASGANDSK